MGWVAPRGALPGQAAGKSISPVVAGTRGLTQGTASTELGAPQNIYRAQAQRCGGTEGLAAGTGTGVVVGSPGPSQLSACGPPLEQDVASLPPGQPGFMSKFQAPHSFPSRSSANVFPAAPGEGTGDVTCPGCAPCAPTGTPHPAAATVPACRACPCSAAGPSRKSAGLKKYQHVWTEIPVWAPGEPEHPPGAAWAPFSRGWHRKA